MSGDFQVDFMGAFESADPLTQSLAAIAGLNPQLTQSTDPFNNPLIHQRFESLTITLCVG